MQSLKDALFPVALKLGNARLRVPTQADAVLFLANWHESRGARIEMFTAGECGIPMYFKADQLPRAED